MLKLFIGSAGSVVSILEGEIWLETVEWAMLVPDCIVLCIAFLRYRLLETQRLPRFPHALVRFKPSY
jgi:hypothetical protein